MQMASPGEPVCCLMMHAWKASDFNKPPELLKRVVCELVLQTNVFNTAKLRSMSFAPHVG